MHFARDVRSAGVPGSSHCRKRSNPVCSLIECFVVPRCTFVPLYRLLRCCKNTSSHCSWLASFCLPIGSPPWDYTDTAKPPLRPTEWTFETKHHLEGTGKQVTHYMVPQVQNSSKCTQPKTRPTAMKIGHLKCVQTVLKHIVCCYENRASKVRPTCAHGTEKWRFRGKLRIWGKRHTPLQRFRPVLGSARVGGRDLFQG